MFPNTILFPFMFPFQEKGFDVYNKIVSFSQKRATNKNSFRPTSDFCEIAFLPLKHLPSFF